MVFSHFYGHSMYLFPSGHGPLKPVLEALREDAREREIPFRLTSMSVADCRAVEDFTRGSSNFIRTGTALTICMRSTTWLI